MAQQTFAVSLKNNSVDLLAQAKHYAGQGNREKAYRLSLEATQKAPDDLEAWLWRANTAPSLEEKLVCLSRVYSLDPYYYRARPSMYNALHELIRREPYLGYINETDNLYQIKSGLEIYINVPKSRAIPEIYPAPGPGLLKSTYFWLILASLGLVFGGIGAVFLAPVAIIQSLFLQFKPLNHSERVRSLVALAAATVIWLAAIPIGLLFILHVIQ